jgi:hypothetical protein
MTAELLLLITGGMVGWWASRLSVAMKKFPVDRSPGSPVRHVPGVERKKELPEASITSRAAPDARRHAPAGGVGAPVGGI